ncbi:MAG: DUF4185 domain-containing protein [Syntrophales bacterium]|nr:DUF4185 domain-containing protein [Syntrophales bacterium]MCK9527996.1 DUF4185 domain-containing protein [Syntrophales bacterium]MDX9921427.1 DUF4185 domain-containing protein [Syntrophales bacterium]
MTLRSTRVADVLAVLLPALLLVISCSSEEGRLHNHPLSPSSTCLPAFPDRDGWYGGDGAYSIRLDETRVLWLFGDSFVSGREGLKDRVGMEVVFGTTLATSTCTDEGEFHIRYWINRKDGRFVSSFGDGEWLWPQDPFMVDHRLYIPLVSIGADPDREGPFPFTILGHSIVRIENFEDEDPNRWEGDFLDLAPGVPGEIMAFATTSVVYGDNVYFYPLYGATENGVPVLGNILARIPLRDLDDPGRSIEYFTGDGRWEHDLEHERVKIVIGAAVSEMSVRYHPSLGKWVALYLSLDNGGDRMLYQTADAPEGPWSEPETLLAPIPEVDPDSPRYHGKTFCYAGKEHRDFSRGRNLVVTYVCNSYEDLEDDRSFLRTNLFLYRPVVNRVPYGEPVMPDSSKTIRPGSVPEVDEDFQNCKGQCGYTEWCRRCMEERKEIREAELKKIRQRQNREEL